MLKRFIGVNLVVVAFTVGLAACTTSLGGWAGSHPKDVSGRYPLAAQTLGRMQQVDPSMSRFIHNAYGYAVFPSVAKGGFVVGGAYGKGAAFHAGSMVARCNMSQATIGLQLGGQVYSEVIFFQNSEAFQNFLSGQFAFAAQATAVAVTAGAAANAAYSGGVAVFSLPKGGLMYEAAVGGQRFSCSK